LPEENLILTESKLTVLNLFIWWQLKWPIWGKHWKFFIHQ